MEYHPCYLNLMAGSTIQRITVLILLKARQVASTIHLPGWEDIFDLKHFRGVRAI